MEANQLADDYYDAKPVCWGFTETKSGVPQYAIEFDVTAFSEAGPETVPVIHKQGFGNEKGLEILTEQLRTCGWKGSDFNAIELDKDTVVRIKIEQDPQYGTKVKGVYAKNGSSAVQRYALADDKRKAVAAELNERLRQMGLAAPATSPVSVANPAHPSNASKPAAPAAPARTVSAQRPAALPAARTAQAPRATQPAQRPAAKPAQRPAQQAQAEDGGWFEPPAETAPEEQPF